jgi:hypothetical protein
MKKEMGSVARMKKIKNTYKICRKTSLDEITAEINIKMYLGEIWCVSGQCPMAGFCEHGNELLGFINTGKLLTE